MEISKPAKIISLILKAVVFFSALVGIIASAMESAEVFMGGSTVFMYFTIQSNIAIALICAIGAVLMFTKKIIPNVWYVIKFIGTIAITLTGIVFCFVLAPAMGLGAWGLTNILTHVVVPIVSVIDFFVTGVFSVIKKKYVFLVTIPPVLYAIYAGIGYIQGWQFAPGVNYPYFFLNWGSPAGAFGFSSELPFMGSAWWIVAIFIFLIIIGLIYLLILDLIRKICRINPVIFQANRL